MLGDAKASNQRGLLVVISGPSGVGKTTVARAVEKRLKGEFSVSVTTRPKTPADTEGRDYYFVNEERFKQMVKDGEFLEHAQVFGKHWYGTPRKPVEQALAAGRLMILEIDVQGGIQVRHAMPAAFMIFLLPPSEEDLLRRLRGRGRDSEEMIQRRFAEAKQEIRLAQHSGAYDHMLVNDDLQKTIDKVCALIQQRRDTMASRH